MREPFCSERYGPWVVVTGATDDIGQACAHQLADGDTFRLGALSKLLGWSLGMASRVLRVRIMGHRSCAA
jgi:hypothetical protein